MLVAVGCPTTYPRTVAVVPFWVEIAWATVIGVAARAGGVNSTSIEAIRQARAQATAAYSRRESRGMRPLWVGGALVLIGGNP